MLTWIIYSRDKIKDIVENIEVVTFKIVLFFRWAWSPNKNSKSFEWTSYKTISRSNSGTHPFRSPGSSGKRQAKRTYRLHDKLPSKAQNWTLWNLKRISKYFSFSPGAPEMLQTNQKPQAKFPPICKLCTEQQEW